MNFLIVGAGLSGAVLAREIVDTIRNAKVDIIDKRGHIGGNCFTSVDEDTGICVHEYGPHIFNTNEKSIFDYICKFVEMKPYVHNAMAYVPNKGTFNLPINLHTLNQYFDVSLNPSEAQKYLEQKTEQIQDPKSFEEQALAFVGQEIYKSFFEGYTLKQWGVHPSKLPASILKRIPVRFNYDANYHNAKYTGIPANGYTEIFERLLDHPQIKLELCCEYSHKMSDTYTHTFYSGTIDGYFNYRHGRLGYRTVYWKTKKFSGDFQGCSQMNYPDTSQEYTRIIEHKHFMPWNTYDDTVVSWEYSKETSINDEPYYPKRLPEDISKLVMYQKEAEKNKNVTFMGRLGTYRYLDMWKVIDEALDLARLVNKRVSLGEQLPTFHVK